MTVTKCCPRCKQSKALFEFARNRSKSSGYGSYCKSCHNRIVRENKEKNHGSEKAFLFKLRYRVDPCTVEWLILQQNGLCAVCREAEPKHVDHDHTTRAVRGLTCFNCNRGLGYFGDDLETMYRAAEYLERA